MLIIGRNEEYMQTVGKSFSKESTTYKFTPDKTIANKSLLSSHFAKCHFAKSSNMSCAVTSNKPSNIPHGVAPNVPTGKPSNISSSKPLSKPFTQLDISPETFICLAALSLYWGLHYGSYFSNTLLVPLNDVASSTPLLYALCLIGAACFHGLIAFSKTQHAIPFSRLFYLVVPALSGIAVATIAIASMLGLSVPLAVAIIAWLLYGFGLGALLLQSHAVLANVNSEQVCFIIALGVVFSAMFFLAILNMNTIAATITIAIMVLALGVMLFRCRFSIDLLQATEPPLPHDTTKLSQTPHLAAKPSQSTAPHLTAPTEQTSHLAAKPSQLSRLQTTRDFRHFLLELFSYSFVFGVAFITTRALQGNGEQHVYPVLAVTLPGFFLVAYSLVLNRYIGIRAILWILIGAMVIGLLPLSSQGIIGFDISCAFLIFSFTCYDMLSFYRLLGLLRTERLSFLRYFALGRFCNASGVALGGLVVVFLQQANLLESTIFTFIVLLMLVALVCLMLFLGYPPFHGEDHDENIDDNNNDSNTYDMGSWRHARQIICERSGLTSREREIFDLLAKGRDTVFISEKLFISSHTVKAHRYHIYEKLAIHSVQELIDMVEQQARADRINNRGGTEEEV
ncbi:MAG: helix-turn-helix transcriptional regulator [Coriobacteriales bacterium]|nr:helix-turn-helix transcriptional regulator [Coriobacteriales bacterium]